MTDSGAPSSSQPRASAGARDPSASRAAPEAGLPQVSALGSLWNLGEKSVGSTMDESLFPRIPGYQITGSLGGGGMGIVWAGLELGTRRQVAIKLMNPALFASDKARIRFTSEVELAAKLDHPNIARVYHCDFTARPYYYAMERVEGVSLDAFEAQHKLNARQIVVVMRRVCRAVEHAHRRGVIHRDLKPTNILVTREGQPKVLDFGLAKLTEQQDAHVSIDGEVTGTPAYMSPEQALGKLDQIDQQTDVYSLGALLFVLLTGQNPHRTEGGSRAVIARVAHEEARTPAEAGAELAPELCAILAKALARDKGERYVSAAALEADLTRYLAGDAVLAHLPSIGYVLRKKVTKHWRRLAVVGLVLVAIAGAGIWGYRQVSDARKQNEDVAAALRKANHDLLVKQRDLTAAKEKVDQLAAATEGRVAQIGSAVRPGGGMPSAPPRLEGVADLEASRQLVSDTFDDPKAGGFAWGGNAGYFRNGLLVIDGTAKPCWGPPDNQFNNFVCETIARTSGDRHAGWGIALVAPAGWRGVEVLLDSAGALRVVPSRWVQDAQPNINSIGPIQQKSFRANDFNSLAVVFRDGCKLAVFVNGIEAFRETTLPYVLAPAMVQLASAGGASPQARLEFKSYRVWSVPAVDGAAPGDPGRSAPAAGVQTSSGRRDAARATAKPIYDLAGDWSDACNPNGPWKYMSNNIPLSPIVRESGSWGTAQPSRGGFPGCFKSNGTERFGHDWQAGTVIAYNPAQIVWTAPARGTVSVSGGVWHGWDTGGFNDWSLLVKHVQVMHGTIGGGMTDSSRSPALIDATDIAVDVGDQLELTLVPHTGLPGDYVGVHLTIKEMMAGTQP